MSIEAIENLLAEYDMTNSAFAKDLRQAIEQAQPFDTHVAPGNAIDTHSRKPPPSQPLTDELTAELSRQAAIALRAKHPNLPPLEKLVLDKIVELRKEHDKKLLELVAQRGLVFPTPPSKPLTDAVINAAREALDASFEAGNDEMDISIPAHLAAALSMRLDEYDAAHGIKENT